jgi:hypothetical protein
MTAAERATELVNRWTKEAIGKPLTQGLARLGILAAEAIAAAEQAAYQRGLQARELPPPSGGRVGEGGESLADLVTLAEALGAHGIWLLRGIENPDLIYNLPGDSGLPACLTIENCNMLLIARFPASDGGEPGIEYHSGNGDD